MATLFNVKFWGLIQDLGYVLGILSNVKFGGQRSIFSV